MTPLRDDAELRGPDRLVAEHEKARNFGPSALVQG
jgi:hypothetical protein